MAYLWTISEQQAIKAFSANNAGRFDEIADITQIKDLKPLIGFDFYQDLIQNPATPANARLLDGDTYTYNGVTYEFKGLKYVLAYLWYANYVMSNMVDTFTGFVVKSNEDSQPASSGDKKNLRDINREVAMSHWEDCKNFLTVNSVDYPYFYFKRNVRKIITL